MPPPAAAKGAAKPGFQEGTSREVPGERGEHTQVFANADGSKTLRVSDQPVNYRTAQGDWQPIDTTLVPATAAGAGAAKNQIESSGGWQTKAGAHPVVIAAGADAPTLTSVTVAQGQSVGFGVAGAAAAWGDVRGDTVSFRDIRPDADLKLDADAGGVKESIVLRSPMAPDVWTFPLNVQGMAPQLDEAGNVAFADASGQVQALIPAGWMMDSVVNAATGEGATSGGVRYALVRRPDGGWELKVSLDRAWLNDPARVYPVVVDPTLVVTPASNSVSIIQNRNYFQTDVYRLGYNCDSGCVNAALLLNTSSVSTSLQNHTITGARLALWNVHTYDCEAPRAVTVHANTAPWNPSTVRYPGPAFGGALGASTFGFGNEQDHCGDAWGVVNLGQPGADLIQGWVTGQPNHGLTVRTRENDPNTWKKFATAPNGGVKLDIDYTPFRAAYRFNHLVRPATANQEGAASITVTNTGAAAWNPGPERLRYRLFGASGELSNVAETPLPHAVHPGQAVTVEARIAATTPGIYTLCWDMATGGSGFSHLGVPMLCQDFDSANRVPELTSMVPGYGYESPTTTPTFTVAGHDPDNWPRNYLDYLFEVCEVEGGNARVNCRSSGPSWQTSPTFTVPAHWGLTKGRTYAWYGYAGDGAAGSRQPNPSVFTIPNRDPVFDAAWPPNGYTFATLTPMLHASGHDTDLWPNQGVEYRFEVCESDGTDHRKNCRASPWGPAVTRNVPTEWNLRWGQNYAWYASIGDKGGGLSSISRPMFFSTQVAQPAVTSHLAQGSDGKEFNAQVGNYTTSASDASVGVAGPELTVRRTYNSMDPRTNTAFGEGWASRWDMRAIPDQDGSGNVVLVLADGRQMRFGRNSDGSYAAPSGGFATFTARAEGGWLLVDKSGARHAFDAAGRLTSVVDGSGRAQVLTYDGSGRLARATDQMSGRYLDFAWTNGHVTTVRTNPVDGQNALTWTYTYDGDRLVAACPPPDGPGPQTSCSRYEYGTGSQYRSVVIDTNPRSYWRLGDAGGPVAASSAVAQGGRDNGTYRNVTASPAGALAGTPDSGAHFNGTAAYVDLPQDLVRANPYFSVELWFRTTAGGTLFSYSQKPVDQQDDSTPGVPVLYVGSDGKLRGQFWNGTFDPMVSAAPVNDGAWHHAVLAGQGNTQTLYLDGFGIGTRAGEIQNLDPVNTIGAGGAHSQWPSRWENDPRGFFDGDIDEVALYDRPLGAVSVSEHFQARRAAAQAVKVLLPSGRTSAEVVYDPLTERVTRLTDSNGGVWQLSAPTYQGSSAPYAAAVTASQPKGYWRLNERTGVSGASALPNQAPVGYGEVRLGEAGIFAAGDDTAAEFNGRGSVVNLEQGALGTGRFSLEMWFRGEEPGVLAGYAAEPLGQATTNTPATPMLYIGKDGKLRGMVWGGAPTPLTSAGSVLDGGWHHAVLTVEGAGGTQTLYLDGLPVGSHVNQGITVDPYVTVGAGVVNGVAWPEKPDKPKGHFKGAIDELALYPEPLTGGAVAEHFSARSKLLASTAPAYRAAVAGSGPWSYWRLNEPNGGLAASQQAVRTGTGNGTAHNTVDQPGIPLADSAARFNGANSYVELPQGIVHGTASVSVEMWFKTTQPGVLFAYQSNALDDPTQVSWMPALYVDTDGKLRGRYFTSTAMPQIVTPNPVNDDQWHHAALTTDGEWHKLYLDGALVGSERGTVFHEKSVRTYVGAGTTQFWEKAPPGRGYFTGLIDEVAIYHKELAPEVVTAHWRAEDDTVAGYRALVEGAGPVGYWPLAPMSDGIARSVVQPPTTDVAGVWNVQHGVQGAFGRDGDTAMGFNGSSSYLRLPPGQLPSNQAFSVEAWFKADAPGVVMGYSTVDFPYSTSTSPGTPMVYIGADGHLRGQVWHGAPTPISTTESVIDNSWHHVVLTIDPGPKKQTLYLDGAEVGALAYEGVTIDPFVTIGAGVVNDHAWPAAPPGPKSHFRGAIDEVAIYRQVLTAQAISAHYAAGSSQTNSRLAVSVSVTDPANNVSTRTYDAFRGRLLTAKDAGGATTTYGYDSGGFLHTVTDPNGNAKVSGHDARGNEISRTTCRTSTSCWTGYQEFFLNPDDKLDPRNDKPIATRDPRSVDAADNTFRTQYAYTPQGEAASITSADGSQTVRTYTTATAPAEGGGSAPAGLLASVTEPGNRTTSYTYYANGDLAATTAPTGLTTRYTYDGVGRKLTETVHSDAVPGGVPTVFTYDASSRVRTATGPGVRNEITGVTHTGRTTRTYDADGNILTETQADLTGGDAARTVTNVYDHRGLVTSAIDAEGGVTLLGYDAFGRRNRVTDAEGNVLAHVYTPRGLLAEVTLIGWKDPAGAVSDLVLESRAYDPAGRLASVTDAMGSRTEFQYYDDDLLAKSTARDVESMYITEQDIVLTRNWYDGAGNLVRNATGGGTRTVEIRRDALGRVEKETFDPGGLHRTTAYQYNAAGDLTRTERTGPGVAHPEIVETTVDAVGRPITQTVSNEDGTARPDTTLVTTHTYDQRGLVTSTKSPNANAGCTGVCETTTTYDILGRPVITAGAEVGAFTHGQAPSAVRPTTTVGYNTFGEAVQTKDVNGNVTSVQVDRLGRATETRLPAYTPPGAAGPLTTTQTQTYDRLGRPLTATDPLGRTTTMKYDQLGNPVERVAPGPDTPTTKYIYTPTGLQISATGPLGELTEATYDRLGRVRTVAQRDRVPDLKWSVTDYRYDEASNLVLIDSPGSRETRMTYNAAGEQVAVREPEGEVTRTSYDGLGRPVQVTLPSGRATATAYSRAGRIDATRQLAPNGTVLATSTNTFDPDGNVTTTTTPAGGRTTFAYDRGGHLVSQVEKVSASEAITTSFDYDAAGNRTRFVDGRGNATAYTYNAWNLNESTIEPPTTAHPAPGDRTWTTVYDAAGQVVTQHAPGGVRTDMTYSPRGLITSQAGSGADAPTIARNFTYDAADRVTSARAGGTPQSPTDVYTYNDRGLLLSTTGPGGDSTFVWNREGEVTERTDAAGTSRFYYDDNSRLGIAEEPLTDTEVRYLYDPDGRLERQTYARITGTGGGIAPMSGTIQGSRNYTYDEFGRLASDTTLAADNAVQTSMTYAYNLDDRITGKTTTGVAGASANTYTYDLAGRLTSHTNPAGTTTYTWDAAGNRTQIGATAATYDERNRLTQAGTTSYGYTPRGTRSTVTEAGSTRTLLFDAFEQLVSDGAATYAYDALGRVAARNGQNGFAYMAMTNSLVTDGTSRFSRASDGTLLAAATGDPANGGTAQLGIADLHGDIVAGLTIDTSSTTLASSRTYDPHGKVTAQAGTQTSLGYQGGYTDPTTGQVNMAARWYDPEIGAFDSRDTWTLNPTPSANGNRYTYGNGDAVGQIDPTGHLTCYVVCPPPIPDIGKVAGKVAGAIAGTAGSAAKTVAPAARRGSMWTLKGVLRRMSPLIGIVANATPMQKEPSQQDWCRMHPTVPSCNPTPNPPPGPRPAQPVQDGGHLEAQEASCRYNPKQPACGWNAPTPGPGKGSGTGKGNGGKPPNKTPIRPVPPPPPPVAPSNRQPTPATPITDQGIAVVVALEAGLRTGNVLQAADHILSGNPFTPQDTQDDESEEDEFLEFLAHEFEAYANGSDVNTDWRQCDSGPAVERGAAYMPRERYFDSFSGQFECRATGVFGAWNSRQKGTSTTEAVRPPGYEEIRAQGEIPHNGHLIPKAAGGSGTDLRNLVPEYAEINTPYLNFGIEREIRKALDAKKSVVLSVTPVYGRRDSGIPSSLRYNYTILGPDDVTSRSCTVVNSNAAGFVYGSPGCPAWERS